MLISLCENRRGDNMYMYAGGVITSGLSYCTYLEGAFDP